MQTLEAEDQAELAAEVSATGVNRSAFSHDRIRRVIRAADGFKTEHDSETDDLRLRPVKPGEPQAADGAPVRIGGGWDYIIWVRADGSVTRISIQSFPSRSR